MMYRTVRTLVSISVLATLLALPTTVLGQSTNDASNEKPTLGTLFEDDMMITQKAFSASVRFAGLVDTLKAEGPFTVFAFTNTAAQPLEDEFPDPQSDPAFHALVKYHIVPNRKLMASDFLTVDELETLEGSTISVETEGGTSVVAEGGETERRVSKQPETIVLHGEKSVKIGSDPTHRNITTVSNGVIHIVQSVLRIPE